MVILSGMRHDLSTPGRRIRFLRESKGWSQATLAKRVFVSQPAVAYWEADTKRPGKQSRELLAAALGCEPAFLFDEAAA